MPGLSRVLQDRVDALQAMVMSSKHIDEDTRSKLQESLNQLQEKVSNKPISLGELKGGDDNLSQFEDKESLKAQAVDPIEYDEEAIAAWKQMCWLARYDMNEDEMFYLTEKTMKKFINSYGCANPRGALEYWKFLVRRFKEIKKVNQAATKHLACKAPSEGKPAQERHAGAVVSSGFMVSQRTEALPDGIEAYNYAPDVSSPTAAMWKQAPRTPESSTRKGGSTLGSRSVASKSVAAKSTAAKSVKGDSTAPSKAGWSR